MKRLHALVLGLVTAWMCSSECAHAQVKFADLPSDGNGKTKEITFQPVKTRADLRHGTMVALQLNDGSKVTGTVVRFDAKNNSLFIRRHAGEAPVIYAEKDIKAMEKAVRQADAPNLSMGSSSEGWYTLPGGLQENANGIIRIPTGNNMPAKKMTGPQNVVEPEILQQVIQNGNQRSVNYISHVLSPAERDVLDQLQRAQNNLQIIASQNDLRDSALAMEMSLQEERIRNQRLINTTMENENSINYPYQPVTPSWAGIPVPLITRGVVTVLPTVQPANSILERMPPIDPQVASKAREDMARLQSQLVYEDGRLIAVLPK